jgi:hypothetical protein
MGLFTRDIRVVAKCEDFHGNVYNVKTTVEGIFKTEDRIKRGIEDQFYKRKRIRLKTVEIVQAI